MCGIRGVERSTPNRSKLNNDRGSDGKRGGGEVGGNLRRKFRLRVQGSRFGFGI